MSAPLRYNIVTIDYLMEVAQRQIAMSQRRIRQLFHGAVALFAMLFMPFVIRAEGDQRVLDCRVLDACDAAGRCEAANDLPVQFTLDPVQRDASGGGDYLISYGGTQRSMRAGSELGPFLWEAGTARHALLISGESHWLWHALETAGAPAAKIRFLACRIL